MDTTCDISKTVYTMKAGWYTKIGFAGGSLTVAMGASNTANTSWRRLFMRHIRQFYLPMYNFQVSEIYGAMGALNSSGLVFTLKRNIFSHEPTIVFVEEAWNDFVLHEPELTKKAVEGVIRQIRSSKGAPDCVLVGVGCKPGTGDRPDGLLDHTLYRELAVHYRIPFADLQEYTLKTLAERGQKWEDIGFDACHLNDYGQRMWFDALREWFDRQVQKYEVEQTRTEGGALPPPRYSDEFQYTGLINPTRKNAGLELEGMWVKDGEIDVPWYFDNLLVGRTAALRIPAASRRRSSRIRSCRRRRRFG